MIKPDFGLSNGVYFSIRWTDQRVAYVRYLAEEKGRSAAAIAVDIGLERSQGPRINAVCKRFDIQLRGQSGRPSRLAARHVVKIPEKYSPLIHRLAVKHSMAAGDLALQLVVHMLDQGEAFLENLLDGE